MSYIPRRGKRRRNRKQFLLFFSGFGREILAIFILDLFLFGRLEDVFFFLKFDFGWLTIFIDWVLISKNRNRLTKIYKVDLPTCLQVIMSSLKFVPFDSPFYLAFHLFFLERLYAPEDIMWQWVNMAHWTGALLANPKRCVKCWNFGNRVKAREQSRNNDKCRKMEKQK